MGPFYYVFGILTFLFSDIFKTLINFEWKKIILKQDILFYFISLIYICSFASLIRVSELVNIEEILIGILRLSLPFILLLSSVKQDKDIKIEGEKRIFKRSLFIAIFLSGLVGALSLYTQAAFSQGLDIINSVPLTRSGLMRFGSTLGNVNSAGLGIPIICIVIFFQKKVIYSGLSKKYLSKIERFFLKIPVTSVITFLLLSTIFTLSRTAIFNSIIVISLIIFLTTFFQEPIKTIANLNSKKIIKSLTLLFIGFAPFCLIYNKFLMYLKLNLSFFGITSNEFPIGYRNVTSDIFVRVFDNRPILSFDIVDFLFGNGIHNAGGILGFKQYSFFYHNTFLNLYQIIGIIGPILIISILFIISKRSICGLLNFHDKNKLNFYLYNLSIIILYIPNLITFAGIFFIPLWISPFIFIMDTEFKKELPYLKLK